MRLPHPERSRIALVGNASFPNDDDLYDLPPVMNNLRELQSIFVDPNLCGIPMEHCGLLLDAENPAEVDEWLTGLAQDSSDLLLVYYAGHGVVGEDDELYFTVRDSNQYHIHRSGVPFAWVKRVMLNTSARARILILDCCFSGHVLSRMGVATAAALRQVDIEGTHVLTASGANITARAPLDESLTAFTGSLVRLLRCGVEGGPEYLTASYLFPFLERDLLTRGMPRPHQQSKDTAGELALVRNAAFASDGSTLGAINSSSVEVGEVRVRRDGYMPARARLSELRKAYDRFVPRAYDRLAHAYYNEGYEEDATLVLIEKQRHRYAAMAEEYRVLGPLVLLWSWLQQWTVGYGYRPIRALFWLLMFWTCGTVYFSQVEPFDSLSPVASRTLWNPALYTFDLIIPFQIFGEEGKWVMAGASQWVAAALVSCGWVLTTCLAAGLTRVLRRTRVQ